MLHMSDTKTFWQTLGKQIRINSVFKSNTEAYSPKHTQQLLLNDLFVENLITGCALPLSIVENKYFHTFLIALNNK